MAWEIYEKVVKRMTSPTLTISKLGRLSFNAAATEILHKSAVEHMLVMWDKDSRKIAVKGVGKKDTRSYTIRYGNKWKISGFAAKTFLNHIQYDFSTTAQYPCTWSDEDEMFEVQLPTERFKSAKRLEPVKTYVTGGGKHA